jgi:hypothetical protein
MKKNQKGNLGKKQNQIKSKIHTVRDERSDGPPPDAVPGLNPTSSVEKRKSSDKRNAPTPSDV